MLILAIDTSHSYCSVALGNNAELIKYKVCFDAFKHSEVLFSLIEEVAGDLKYIDYIGVSTGPGSFTGIRVGLSAAHGINISLGTPIIGISNFEIAYSKCREQYYSKEIIILKYIANDIYSFINGEINLVNNINDVIFPNAVYSGDAAFLLQEVDGITILPRFSISYARHMIKPLFKKIKSGKNDLEPTYISVPKYMMK